MYDKMLRLLLPDTHKRVSGMPWVVQSVESLGSSIYVLEVLARDKLYCCDFQLKALPESAKRVRHR
jgi:hypothetical protein